MKVSLRLRSDAPNLSSSTAEDLFFRSQCALWGARILAVYRHLDKDTLEYLIWVLDPASGITTRILEHIGVEDENVIASIPKGLENQATALFLLLSRLDSEKLSRVVEILLSELEVIARSSKECDMSRGLDHIASTYGLSSDECALAFFLASIAAWPHLERYFDNHLECDRPSGRKYLMTALDMSKKDLRKAIGGKLARIGILDINHTWMALDSDYAPLFTDPSDNPLLAELHRAVPTPDLATKDLGVDATDLSLMSRLLTSQGDFPVHILLYGAPGTGKTTLAQGLIHENGLDGLEVMGRSEGTIKQRRGALEACLNMSTGVENRVVVIDEADRLLNTGSSWSDHGEKSDKAWLNDVLERRGLRCVWVVNDTSAMDPAVRRRIDFSLELPLPDIRKRRTMLEHVLRNKQIKRHFSGDEIQAIARDYTVSPAILSVAAETASLNQESSLACRETYIKALNSQLRLAGAIPPAPRTNLDEFLREGINTSIEYDMLVDRVRAYDELWRSHSAGAVLPPFNLLFHGAPGTGKSYTARHLADLIDRPVLMKRASDLLNPYVGMSEKSVAAAFAEARETGAVLVIDEIDSFLYKRGMAHRTWEANLVSEFLVQLEQGPVITIGTTNRFASIDPAALRRIIFVTEFMYLKSAQIIASYEAIFGDMSRGALSTDHIRRLSSLKTITIAALYAVHNTCMLSNSNDVLHDYILDELSSANHVSSDGSAPQTSIIGF